MFETEKELNSIRTAELINTRREYFARKQFQSPPPSPVIILIYNIIILFINIHLSLFMRYQ